MTTEKKARTLLASVAVGAVIGAGLTQLGIARADTTDDLAYLQTLTNSGLVLTSPAAALATGYAACNRMVWVSDTAAALELAAYGGDPYAAAVMVAAAETVLCPAVAR